MATTPNIPLEQSTKQTVRANTRGGANSYSAKPADLINAANTLNGLWRLSTTDTVTAFTISGAGGVSSTLYGTTTVSGLKAALTAGPLAGVFYTVNASDVNYLGPNTVDILVPSGAVLAVVVASGVTATATLTNVSISGGMNVSYPSYVGTPNTTPNWTDDATVHAYPITGFGNTTQDTTKTVQTQVAQIQTGEGPEGTLETQQWDNYFNQYQSNLNQTSQVNTKQQQC